MIAGAAGAATAPAARAFRRAALWMCGASAAWAVVEFLGRLVPRGHSPYQLVLVRYAIHLAFMVLLFGRGTGVGLIRTGRPAMQWTRSLLMLGMPVCFITAAGLAPHRDIWAVFWVAPIAASAVAAVRWQERLSVRRWLVLAAGLLGALAALRPGARAVGVAALLAAGMGACFAAYVVMTRLLRSEPTATNVFYTALGVFVTLAVAAPVFWTPLDVAAFLPMAGVGIVGFAGLYALDKALAGAEVTAVAPLLYTQLVFALPIAAAAGERVSRSALAGTALIAAAASWYVFAETREKGSIA